jgi:hypothetical protein
MVYPFIFTFLAGMHGPHIHIGGPIPVGRVEWRQSVVPHRYCPATRLLRTRARGHDRRTRASDPDIFRIGPSNPVHVTGPQTFLHAPPCSTTFHPIHNTHGPRRTRIGTRRAPMRPSVRVTCSYGVEIDSKRGENKPIFGSNGASTPGARPCTIEK